MGDASHEQMIRVPPKRGESLGPGTGVDTLLGSPKNW
jgi:hypothetical protein